MSPMSLQWSPPPGPPNKRTTTNPHAPCKPQTSNHPHVKAGISLGGVLLPPVQQWLLCWGPTPRRCSPRTSEPLCCWRGASGGALPTAGIPHSRTKTPAARSLGSRSVPLRVQSCTGKRRRTTPLRHSEGPSAVELHCPRRLLRPPSAHGRQCERVSQVLRGGGGMIGNEQ